MVTQEQISAWKKEFGKIYKIIPIPDLEIIFRPLSRTDYVDILQGQVSNDSDDPEIQTVKICVLNNVPDDLYYSHGGLATVIYEEIMKKSGFVIVESEEL